VNIAAAAAALRETAGLGNRVREGTYMESTTPGCQFLVQRRAVGVVVGIAPWNAPMYVPLLSLHPAADSVSIES
jgi:acyl-CoA reductase-like NAD-dependent aldehyde dehydrogenase